MKRKYLSNQFLLFDIFHSKISKIQKKNEYQPIRYVLPLQDSKNQRSRTTSTNLFDICYSKISKIQNNEYQLIRYLPLQDSKNPEKRVPTYSIFSTPRFQKSFKDPETASTTYSISATPRFQRFAGQ